jgi:bifunctional non-homologous end joining protein LigD
MADPFSALPAGEKTKLRQVPEPAWVDPMLATLVHEPSSRPGWIYEPKLDGERCFTYKKGSELRLLSRNQKLLNGGYPELVAALSPQGHDFILDGEVVAFAGGVTSFKTLQGRIGLHDERAAAKNIPIFYYIFDILYLDGYDVRRLPLQFRKMLLRAAVSFHDPLRFTTHVEGDGVAAFRQACQRGEEGVMSKDFTSPYQSVRSTEWLKFKCVKGQEMVIGGYTPGIGRRQPFFGALLLGYYQRGQLRYAGKVGTGFDDATLVDLTPALKSLRQSASPFAEKVSARGAVWVKPELVAEIVFAEWTQFDRLRVPRFEGLRRDKAAREVEREG